VVVRRFLKLRNWKEAERIIVGGGFINSRVGELAIGRTSTKADILDQRWLDSSAELSLVRPVVRMQFGAASERNHRTEEETQ